MNEGIHRVIRQAATNRMTASGVAAVLATLALLGAPAAAQELQRGHAPRPVGSLSVTFSNGLLSVHAVDLERGDVLREIARQVGIRIRADSSPPSELVATSYENVPVEIGIRRLVPLGFDLILIYVAGPGADREGRLSEVWLVRRRTGGEAVAVREPERAGPPQNLPSAEPLATTQPAAANDPSMALSRVLVKLTDGDTRMRAAAVEALGEDVGAGEVLGQVLAQSDGAEAAAYALGWLIRER